MLGLCWAAKMWPALKEIPGGLALKTRLQTAAEKRPGSKGQILKERYGKSLIVRNL